MTSKRVSRTSAETILRDIRRTYGAPEGADGGPVLRDAEHEEQSPGSWSIGWEEGPYEWALNYSQRAAGRFLLLEPINSFTLGIYRP